MKNAVRVSLASRIGASVEKKLKKPDRFFVYGVANLPFFSALDSISGPRAGLDIVGLSVACFFAAPRSPAPPLPLPLPLPLAVISIYHEFTKTAKQELYTKLLI